MSATTEFRKACEAFSRKVAAPMHSPSVALLGRMAFYALEHELNASLSDLRHVDCYASPQVEDFVRMIRCRRYFRYRGILVCEVSHFEENQMTFL